MYNEPILRKVIVWFKLSCKLEVVMH